MDLNHGINTYKSKNEFITAKKVNSGIPFYVGAWPCHTAGGFTGKPQIAYGFAEAKKLGGYSKEWRNKDGSPKWRLCSAMFYHLQLVGIAPVIFYNVFDPSKHKTEVSEESATVKDHVAELSEDVIASSLVIKTSAQSVTLKKGEDYMTEYGNGKLYIVLVPTSTHYNAETLVVSYNKANPSAITADDICEAIEKVEMCKSLFGIVPDIIAAPGYSKNPTVAAVLAAKAASINTIFKGKTAVDIDTSENGVRTPTELLAYKNENGYTDENMIVCWPCARNGDYIFDMSIVACARIALTDAESDNFPNESPSNLPIKITGTCLEDGTEVCITEGEADVISYNAGVVTAYNNDGWVLWGNYLGCFPAMTDVDRIFICTSRTQDFIANTFIMTYWKKVDRNGTRVQIDSIVESFNAWLGGLIHDGKLLGGKVEYIPDNNNISDITAGRFRFDTQSASPVPMQRIDNHFEYSVDMLNAALNG